MGDNGKVKILSTFKKDEAAFYLAELARGLLKNRVSLRVGERNLVMAAFDQIRMEMKAFDKNERYAVDIRLSWNKPLPDITAVGANGDSVRVRTPDQP